MKEKLVNMSYIEYDEMMGSYSIGKEKIEIGY